MNAPMPIIKIEIDRLREQIAGVLIDRNAELNDMIAAEIEKQITLPWVQAEMAKAVRNCMQQAFENIGNNYKLQKAIEDLAVEQLTNSLEGESSE